MGRQQVAKSTERYTLTWPIPLAASSISEDHAPAIGQFLLQIDHPLRPECERGTLKGAAYYATRLFDYHRDDPNYPLSLQASTIVRNTSDDLIVGVCMVGGGGDTGKDFAIYDIQVDPARRNQGIGTRMIQRALSTLSEHGILSFRLWHDDDSRARTLYERLGFKPTGKVE